MRIFTRKPSRSGLRIPNPATKADERVVILFTLGYKNSTSALAGFHRHRDKMPGERHPYGNRTGFLEMTWHNIVGTQLLYNITAHELQHLIQHHYDVNEASWVNEGLSVLTSAYLDYSEFDQLVLQPFQDQPYSQLNQRPDLSCGYGPGFLFTTYILERLGLEGLRDFVRRPENGLAALDATLAERGDGLDTETFYADFVLANYLRDTQLGDGRFGYHQFASLPIPKPYVRGRIIEFPTLAQQSLPNYATDYYDFVLRKRDQPQHLELALQFPNSASRDGWLQFVQVVAGEVVLERYRASDYRNQMIPVTLHPDAERAFLAVSPFQANARYLTTEQPYILKIHLAGSDSDAADYATTESSLSLDSAEPAKATEQRTPLQLSNEIDEILDHIIENKYSIGIENNMGEFIAHVEELIAAGAAIDGSFGGSFLVKVVRRIQSPELLALFLENGADPNRGENYSFSPTGITGLFSAKPLNFRRVFWRFCQLKTATRRRRDR